MLQIKFIRDATSGEGGSDRPKAGDVLTVNEASAHRWIRRGAAVSYTEEPKPEKKVTKKKPSSNKKDS